MAFGGFDSLIANNPAGDAGRFVQIENPDEILEHFGAKQQQEEPQTETGPSLDPNVQALMQRNAELERMLQDTSKESSRKIGELSGQLRMLQDQHNYAAVYGQQQQHRSQGDGTKKAAPQQQQSAQENMDTWWAQLLGVNNQQTPPPQQQQAQQEDPPVQHHIPQQQQIPQTATPHAVVGQVLNDWRQQYEEEARKEDALYKQFSQKYPNLLKHGQKLLTVWNRYKQLNPKMPVEERYQLFEAEVQQLFGEAPKNLAPPSGGQFQQGVNGMPVASSQYQQLVMREQAQERQRAIDTANYVKERQKSFNEIMNS